mmetsp:Transcript_23745/g.53525  ORF Transcript_23745/g.53525 Transcript_23745/m.53525 type:complete len:244 (+) Transcript_23745:1-732(+)
MGWGGWGKGGYGWGESWGWGVQKPWLKRNSDGKLFGVVEDSFTVDESQVYTGTVESYWKLKGYGFIALETKGLVPEDKIFVYYDNLNSADRYPMLQKELKVQFTIAKEVKNGKTSLTAKNVSLPGGEPIALQDESDAQKKFVGGQNIRYTGTLKFFQPKGGFGYVKIDEGFAYDVPDVPKEIRIETAEVNCGGQQPGYMSEVKVEFGIWVNSKMVFKAYNCTAPGGNPLPVGQVEPKAPAAPA